MPIIPDNYFQKAATKAVNTLTKEVETRITGAIDAVAARLTRSGLLANGVGKTNEPSIGFGSSGGGDWRLRVGLSPQAGIFYNSGDPGILAPLKRTGGVVFPYTPTVTINYANNYSSIPTTHSINSIQAYNNSEVSSISISATFTAQNRSDADYVLAAVHFFRSASKMFFGTSSTGNEGNPPPLLFLNGYGPQYFNNVPTIMSAFSHSLGEDVDYINTSAGTRIPTHSSISLTLIPQYSRQKMSGFNLDKFASGDLLTGGFI